MNYEIFGINLTLLQYIILFLVCQFINVALNTLKTIIMHKEEKISSSIINAITYGFYSIIVVMTASSLPLWITIVITVITNLIGVYTSMLILEKLEKDKLWEIVATVDTDRVNYLETALEKSGISFTCLVAGNGKFVFNIYSENQKQSTGIKEKLEYCGAKYIVHEERVRL